MNRYCTATALLLLSPVAFAAGDLSKQEPTTVTIQMGADKGQHRFTPDALTAIAKRAIKRKTGARGLRSIMEDILLDTMFELPGLGDVSEVVVKEEAVNAGAQPLLVHSEAKKKEPAAAG